MEKILTLEFNKQAEFIELHFNKEGAEYLKNILTKLIENDEEEHVHLMTPDWGGNELDAKQQNTSNDFKLIHQLKIMYWKE